MELTIKDRLYLPSFLPARGNFKEFNLKKEILRKIAISDDERQEINLRENAEDKRIEWDVEKERPLLVEFSKEEMDYLKRHVSGFRTRSCRMTCGLPWRPYIMKLQSPKHKTRVSATLL